jgi:hypothetical protein
MRINRTCGVSMGHFADASLIPSRDVFWNHYGGRTVKMTRQDTGALRRPQRGIKTQKRHKFRGDSAPAPDRRAAASWIGPRAGMSQDSWRGFTQSDFKTNDLQARQKILGL